jgi:Domain of unknown function (DUF5710)
MFQNRVYLNVPYAEKDAVRQLGARWDAKAKRWFIASELQFDSFAQWLPLLDEVKPNILPPLIFRSFPRRQLLP